MKLVLSDKTELSIESYEYIVSGEDAGGIKVGIKDVTVDALPDKLAGKLDEIKVQGDPVTEMTAENIVDGAINTTPGEILYQLKHVKIGDLIYKDTTTGVVTFTLKPRGIDFDIEQNKADIAAINEAIAHMREDGDLAKASETYFGADLTSAGGE